jgi:hypothetical protein
VFQKFYGDVVRDVHGQPEVPELKISCLFKSHLWQFGPDTGIAVRLLGTDDELTGSHMEVWQPGRVTDHRGVAPGKESWAKRRMTLKISAVPEYRIP